MNTSLKPIDIEKLKVLKQLPIGNNIICIDEVDSTNDYGKSEDLEEGTIITTNKQTKGRGRNGNDWENKKNADIAMSIILKPNIKITEVTEVTLIAGIAVKKALESIINEKTYIKWPNDIIIDNKKVCGILVESILIGGKIEKLVLGIGINVNREYFPKEIEEKATSIYQITKKIFQREEIIIKTIESFNEIYYQYLDNGLKHFIEEYKSYCINLNRQIKAIYKDKEIIGKCVDINEDGHLILEDSENNNIQIISGEVSVRGIYGYVV